MTRSFAVERPAVVFDLGKVLVDFDFNICAKKIQARSQISHEQVCFLVRESDHLIAFETGLISASEFYQRIRNATGYNGTQEEFQTAFADIFTPIHPMIRLNRDLRSGGIETFIFSNTNELAIDHIARSFDFYSDFTGHILSYEQHVMKPAAPIYHVVEQISGRQGPALIYFDDRRENVATALDRGWRAFVHETPEKSLSIIRSLGL